MSKRLLLMWGVGICLVIAARFGLGDRTEAWLDASGAVVGVVGTLSFLLYAAGKKRSQNMDDVEAGRYLWACQVRAILPRGGWGLSARLTVAPDGTTRLEPDRASLKRGASEQAWPGGQARITRVTQKRDITGIRYDVIELDAQGSQACRFGVFGAAGTLPAPEAHA